jgi:threonine synthase
LLRLYANLFREEPDGSAIHRSIREHLSGYAVTDEQTETTIRDIYERHGYTIDPHGAVGYLALRAYRETHPDTLGVILGTAHPSKFKPDVERILGRHISVPPRLAQLADKNKVARKMNVAYSPFKKWLLNEFAH